ncbi:MAG: hypothetical protein ABFC38_02340 [Methanospirillum sp.]
MLSLENCTYLVAVAIGLVLAAVALYPMPVRLRRFVGRHLPLQPSSPRPGTVPRMTRGLRESLR